MRGATKNNRKTSAPFVEVGNQDNKCERVQKLTVLVGAGLGLSIIVTLDWFFWFAD